MKAREHGRHVLHVDLEPFFVSVERSLDPSLRGRPVIVGGDDAGNGLVASLSEEARRAGIRAGEPVAVARRRCPEVVAVPGDLERYAAFSQDVTDILLTATRRVERPSVDEAFADLARAGPLAPGPVAVAERLKDDLQRRLGLDASFGLASSRLAARVASGIAKPRGLLIVLAGHERSFLDRQGLEALSGIPSQHLAALSAKGFATLGSLADADPAALAAVVGSGLAVRLPELARGEGEPPIEVAAPPLSIHEEATVRSPRPDTSALAQLLDDLARRACRRLRPFALRAGSVAVEVRRSDHSARREERTSAVPLEEESARGLCNALGVPLLRPPAGVRHVQVRLGHLTRPSTQVPLFPGWPAAR